MIKPQEENERIKYSVHLVVCFCCDISAAAYKHVQVISIESSFYPPKNSNIYNCVIFIISCQQSYFISECDKWI